MKCNELLCREMATFGKTPGSPVVCAEHRNSKYQVKSNSICSNPGCIMHTVFINKSGETFCETHIPISIPIYTIPRIYSYTNISNPEYRIIPEINSFGCVSLGCKSGANFGVEPRYFNNCIKHVPQGVIYKSSLVCAFDQCVKIMNRKTDFCIKHYRKLFNIPVEKRKQRPPGDNQPAPKKIFIAQVVSITELCDDEYFDLNDPEF